MTQSKLSNFFVHTLLRARDWQHRPQFDQVCEWWRAARPKSENANFVHPVTNEEYNFRAAETFQVLKDLSGLIRRVTLRFHHLGEVTSPLQNSDYCGRLK